MPSDSTRRSVPVRTSGSAGSTSATSPADAARQQNQAKLSHALHTDVIPRLVQAHRPAAAAHDTAAAAPFVGTTVADIETLVQQLLAGHEAALSAAITRHRQRGVRIEQLYIDVLAPSAHRLGLMWEDDLCDFASVTVALGRLQRLLRELSPAFCAERPCAPTGRRALFAQAREEQHSFGLSMVAEFFRRDGWDVLGGVGQAVPDAAALVSGQWFDVVGLSAGCQARLPWLAETVRAIRLASLNRDLRVLVGGPPFAADPTLAQALGADGSAASAALAPVVAEDLLKAR